MHMPGRIVRGLVAIAAVTVAFGANAQEVKHYRFAHDQQLNSGYSIAYDIFSAKLKELSKGTMLVDQFPGRNSGRNPRFCNWSDLAISISRSSRRRIHPRSRRRQV